MTWRALFSYLWLFLRAHTRRQRMCGTCGDALEYRNVIGDDGWWGCPGCDAAEALERELTVTTSSARHQLGHQTPARGKTQFVPSWNGRQPFCYYVDFTTDEIVAWLESRSTIRAHIPRRTAMAFGEWEWRDHVVRAILREHELATVIHDAVLGRGVGASAINGAIAHPAH